MHRHHYLALAAIALTVGLGVAFGYADHIGAANGLFFAVTTATTVGYGDIIPHGWVAHLLAVIMMITIVPLLGATFASLTAMHVRKHVRAHVDRALEARSQPEQPAEGEQQ